MTNTRKRRMFKNPKCSVYLFCIVCSAIEIQLVSLDRSCRAKQRRSVTKGSAVHPAGIAGLRGELYGLPPGTLGLKGHQIRPP